MPNFQSFKKLCFHLYIFCGKFDEDGFERRSLSYRFKNDKTFDLEREIMLAGKRARGASVASTSVHMPALPVTYRDRGSRATLKSVQKDNEEYRDVHSGPIEASREAGIWVQAMRRGAEAITATLAEPETKLSELELKVQLLAEKTSRAGDVWKLLITKTEKLKLVKRN